MNMSRIDRFEAQQLASDMLKHAGFTLFKVALATESCYYQHPARAGLLLRLSAHKSNKGPPIGLEAVLVNVSFTEHDERHLLTPTVVRNRVTWAIGHYFLADPKVSKYKRSDKNQHGLSYKECRSLPLA